MAKKFSPRDLESFREHLLQARVLLSGDISQLEEEALGEAASVTRSNGDGSDGYSQEFNLELLEHDGSTLREVVEALQRIAEGTFGRCEGCEIWITRARLMAVPHARLCIDCKRVEENHQ